jgi:hypothetical protein
MVRARRAPVHRSWSLFALLASAPTPKFCWVSWPLILIDTLALMALRSSLFRERAAGALNACLRVCSIQILGASANPVSRRIFSLFGTGKRYNRYASEATPPSCNRGKGFAS